MKLKAVKARQGASWLRSGFLVFFRRPLAFTALFAGFLLGAFVLLLVPLGRRRVAADVAAALTLGFMLATQYAIHEQAPTPAVFVAAVARQRAAAQHADPARHRLCGRDACDHRAQRLGRRRQVRGAAGRDGRQQGEARRGRRKCCSTRSCTSGSSALRAGRRAVGAVLVRIGARALGRPRRRPGALFEHAGRVARARRVRSCTSWHGRS